MSDVGSIAIGAWIVRIAFAILVVQAFIEGKARVGVVAVGLGLIGWFAIPRLNAYLVTPYLAVLDIGLVFSVWGRDLRLN
jgi:hypothetical protein